MVFTGFLSGQIIFDLLDISATSKDSKSENAKLYESVFKKLEMNTTKKEKIILKKLKSPIVILNFWASWCGPCRREFPSLVELRKKYTKEQVSIFAINVEEDSQMKAIIETIKEDKLNFDIIADKNTNIFDKFELKAVPVTIIFNKGKAYNNYNGGVDFMDKKLLEYFDKSLKK
jgi:thiol-disulfide isomerase/thioredoxin